MTNDIYYYGFNKLLIRGQGDDGVLDSSIQPSQIVAGSLDLGSIQILPDENTGLVATDDDSAEIFKIITGGDDVGDVIMGASAGQHAKWDKSAGTFAITGIVTASSGAIGGWTISSVALYKDGATDAVSSGMAPADYPFYAGSLYANRATAPFRVTPAGAVTATSATITGSLTTGAGSAIDGQYLGNLTVATGALANLAVTAGKIANATITATQIAALTITAAEIANATITTTQIAANTIAAGNIAALTITAAEIANNTITAGQITNATITTTEIAANTIVAGNIAASTITTSQISATAGIVGGQIANLTIAAGNITNLTITAAQIANTTITGGKIASDTITGAKLKIGNQSWSHDLVFSSTDLNTVSWALGTITMADGSTTYSIAANNTDARLTAASLTSPMNALCYIYLDIATSVTELQCSYTASTAVGDGKILIAVAKNSTTEATFQVYGGIGGIAITGGDIESASIVAAQIASDAIVEAKILNSAVTESKIAADAVTATKINVVGLNGATGRIVVADATDADVVTGGINTYATTLITAGKIVISGATNLSDWRNVTDATKIEGGSIYTNTITATQIAANTITAAEIGANVITAAEIFAGTITTTQIAANTIVAGNIAAATITGTEIAATTIAAANIAANTITAAQIAAGTITATEITVATLSALSANLGTITAGTISTDVLIVGTNVITAETRFNTLFNRDVFIGFHNDGAVESGSGTSWNIARYVMTSLLTAGHAGGDATLVTGTMSHGGLIDYVHDFELVMTIRPTNLTDLDVWFGVGIPEGTTAQNATYTGTHIGFTIMDAALYATNANGTTQVKTLIEGITLNVLNNYRIALDAGTNIKFYVNDVLEATHTTYLPTLSNALEIGFNIQCQHATQTRDLIIKNGYTLIRNLT